MKARLRRASVVLFRPVAVALQPQLERLEQRLRERLEQLENHVATDAEVAAEMTITQVRSTTRLGERLAAIEARLEGPGVDAGTGADAAASRVVILPWVFTALAGVPVPSRVGVSASAVGLLADSLAGLGHDVVELGNPDGARGAGPVAADHRASHPDLDAAVVLGVDAVDRAHEVDPARVSRAAARVVDGGTLVVVSALTAGSDLTPLLAGLVIGLQATATQSADGRWAVHRGDALEAPPAGALVMVCGTVER